MNKTNTAAALTYRVTMNGVVMASGLTAAQLMASDWSGEPDAVINEEDDMNKTNTAAIESLRSFAEANSEIEFAHLCTAALAGEEWAAERIGIVIATIEFQTQQLIPMVWDDEDTLVHIRTTDTTRPDGAIARTAVEV